MALWIFLPTAIDTYLSFQEMNNMLDFDNWLISFSCLVGTRDILIGYKVAHLCYLCF